MIRVIGIDPGKVLTWTIVDVGPRECQWVDSGTIESSLGVEHNARWLYGFYQANQCDLCAWELYDPGEWVGGARAGAAIDTWQCAAMRAGYLMSLIGENRVVYASAQTWRRGTIGTRSPKDSEIKHWLTQWGKLELPKRTNADARDAAGLAIYAGRELLRARGQAA